MEHKSQPASSSGEAADMDGCVERYQRLVRWRLARWVPRQEVDALAREVFQHLRQCLATDAAADAVAERPWRTRRRLPFWLLGQARERARQHVQALQASKSRRLAYRRWRARRRRPLPPVEALSTARLQRAYRVYRQRAESRGETAAAWQAAAVRCLASLPLRYRQIVEAYYLQARSAQNIANHLQRSPASVQQILLRVRRLLARAVADLPPPAAAWHGDLVLASLPKVRWGERSDAHFLADCLTAGAATVGAEKTPLGPPMWESEQASGVVELSGPPPVAVEPPPRVASSDLGRAGRTRRARLTRPWALVGLAAGLGSVVIGGVVLSFGGWHLTPGMTGANGPGGNNANGAAAIAAVGPGPETGREPTLDPVVLDPVVLGPVMQEPIERAQDEPPDQTLAADPANWIKDLGPLVAGQQITELGWGRLIVSPDAQWQRDPTAALGRALAAWEPAGVALPLVRGQASLELAAGGVIRFQAPAQLRVRRAKQGPGGEEADALEVEITEGHFHVQVAPVAQTPTRVVLAGGTQAVLPSASEVWLQVSPEFGTTLEVLAGSVRLLSETRAWGAVELQSDGDYLAQVLPAAQGERGCPAAMGVVQRNGGFVGMLVHDRRPLRVSQPTTFAATFQIVLRRLREAPARFDEDWRVVLEQLEAQHRAARRAAAGDGAGPLYSGDRLPESPELQQLLARGLAGPPGLADRFGGQNFAGQLNFNGRVIDLGAIGELDKVRQELQAELNQARGARANGRGNRRPRGNPADPDEMVQQMLDHQLRQLEVMANLVNRFPGDAAVVGLADVLPGAAGVEPAPVDPVVHHFRQLTTGTGQEDRAAARQHLLAALESGLENDQQRAERLEAMRRKLHER